MFGGDEVLVWVNLRINFFEKCWCFNGDGGRSLFGAGGCESVIFSSNADIFC